MIDLGSEARDILTGFKGIAVSRIDHLFGASEIKLQAKELDDNGKPKDPVWFEESRLEVLVKANA